MDLATIIGIILALGMLLTGILANSPLHLFLDPPAAMIVIGGLSGAILINYPLQQVLRLFVVVRHAFFTRSAEPGSIIRFIIDLSNKARREGILALEPMLKAIEDPFLRKGLQLTVDGMEPKAIREIMQIEITYLEERHEVGASILQNMGTLAPALGLTGTLIGLVQMLQKMNDPSTIGPAMAVGLVATFYGVVLANILFNPLAGKLRLRSKEESLLRELMVEGIVAISTGDNPRIILERLNGYLAPHQRVESR